MSSEQIAKALKGAGLSAEERIDTAVQAWKNDKLFFPNKDDFLLEWLCTALTRSKLKSSTDTAVIQVAYWQLLQELLAHYTERVNTTGRSPPSIRVPLITSVTTLLNRIKKDPPAQQTELLEYVSNALALLFSPIFALSYRPTFEHMVAVMDQLLETLATHIDNGALANLAKVLLKRYNSQIMQSANHKKAFTVVVGKTFPALLSIRRRIAATDNELSLLLTDLLSSSLFHPDSIMEYTSIFRSSDAASFQSNKSTYVYKLFEELGRLLKKPESVEDVLDVIPVLYSRFVRAFRKKRVQTSGQDTVRHVEFGFLVECHKILEQSSEVDTLCQLLHVLLELNVYVARNDDVSRSQHAFLDDIAENAVNLLACPKDCDQASVMRLIDALLQIDLLLVEARMNKIWPVLIQPQAKSLDTCMVLALSVLSVYSASRQMDAFIGDLLTALKTVSPKADIDPLLTMPCFSRRFLDEFSTVISKSLPTNQAPVLFEQFANELYQDSSPAVIRLMSIFFAQFITSVNLTQHQRRAFESQTHAVFDRFIKPSLEKSQKNQGNLLAALQLHTALTNSMADVYWATLNGDTRGWLAEALQTRFDQCHRQDTKDSHCVTVLSVTALLQHAYFSYLNIAAEEAPQSSSLDIVGRVLDFVLEDHQSVSSKDTWDGSLVHLDSSAVKIACWKLITDEWFDVICRSCVGERAKKLTELVLTPLLETPWHGFESNQVSIPSINQSLLRSANFYEATSLQEYAATTVIHSLAEFFKAHVGDTASGKIARVLATMEGAWTADQLAELATWLEEGSDMDICSDDDTAKLEHMLDLLLLFPMEYYHKSNRSILLRATLLIDAWANAGMRKSGPISLRARTLLLRLMSNYHGQHGLETNVDLMSWFLDSASDIGEPGILHVTKQIDLLVLRSLMTQADGDSDAAAFLDSTFKQRLQWLKAQQPNASCWTMDAVESVIGYLKAHPTKCVDADTTRIVFAADIVSQTSKHVIHCLKQAHSVLLDAPEEGLSILTKDILALASLLHEYDQLVKPQSGKIVDANELSQHMVRLASPFTVLVQRSLRSPMPIHDRILETTTAFVGSLCRAVSQYQHAYVTERVLAVIWFIVTLVYDSDQKSVQQLCDALSSWVKTLDQDQYAVVLAGFIAQADRMVDQGREHIYLTLLATTVQASTQSQKPIVRRQFSTFVTKLTMIGVKRRSVKFIHQALLFMADLIADINMAVSKQTLSLVLTSIIQLTNVVPVADVDQPTSRALFDAVHLLMQNILIYRREQLVDVLPVYIAIVQSLLQCFRSTHLALTSKSNKERLRTYTLLIPSAPLDTSAAERMARLFSAMEAKFLTEGKNQRLSAATQNKLISKHVPFLLLEYFSIQAHPAMSISQPQVKTILEQQGLYNLMDMVNESQRHMILASLNEAGKLLFKNFYSSWKENHMYKGQ
ncbi:hypothetical protein RO3G_10807 [Lichtheimia corymbifera JMRC:FSU:9682]|uniref:Nucleolar 27S pre-rRNA processing Urb2/Npa2 C-terminal domain-containing protein n=1 Tax=Lichtheimia corymbifera JMRC:FSU:9682 TaxID=1263082 RepID=A0A068RR65_9FUNG|nr:hypothetical protein RO3G_10807 [Lichtheimia corymbifera JMRC:FSU:9682]